MRVVFMSYICITRQLDYVLQITCASRFIPNGVAHTLVDTIIPQFPFIFHSICCCLFHAQKQQPNVVASLNPVPIYGDAPRSNQTNVCFVRVRRSLPRLIEWGRRMCARQRKRTEDLAGAMLKLINVN